MKWEALLPILSNLVGRDLSKEANLFLRARDAIGQSLNKEGQEFFTENYPDIVRFMETPEGQKSIGQFMESWVASMVPKSIVREPEKSTLLIAE